MEGRVAKGLKSLMADGALCVPGVYNAAVAMLAQKAGFGAIYISGAGLANSCGLPDEGLLARAEVKKLASYIINAVEIPAIADVDTGFGGPSAVAGTVRLFEGIGARAVQIEDQVFPKRCGHLPGKRVVSAGVFVAKIKAAVSARKSKDFLIIARTDARAVGGIKDAVQRARLYAKAGADVIFPEALESRAEFAAFSKALKGVPLMANMTEFGKTPCISVKEFSRMGYRLVIFPMTAFRAAMKASETALEELKSKGTQKGILKKLQTRAELYKLLGYSH